jgi:dUTP pyrophosphatase
MSYRMIEAARRLMCDKFSILCTLAELNAKQLREDERMIPVKVKRLHPDAVIPKYAHEDDVCFDLVAIEDVVIEPGGTKKVRTGIALQQPKGYEIQIRPRSGISEKTKLRISNAPGTIDQYTGEIGVLMDNIHSGSYPNGAVHRYGFNIDGSRTKDTLRYGAYIVRKGDRIAQAVVKPVEPAEFIEVNELDETERGDGGFGSSGVK